MDIIKLLPEYLDTGVEAEELAQIAQAALAKRIRDLKLAIAEAVVQARACTLLDNLEGSHQALQRARQLQREYHHFYAEWKRLTPGLSQGLSRDEISPDVSGPIEAPGPSSQRRIEIDSPDAQPHASAPRPGASAPAAGVGAARGSNALEPNPGAAPEPCSLQPGA